MFLQNKYKKYLLFAYVEAQVDWLACSVALRPAPAVVPCPACPSRALSPTSTAQIITAFTFYFSLSFLFSWGVRHRRPIPHRPGSWPVGVCALKGIYGEAKFNVPSVHLNMQVKSTELDAVDGKENILLVEDPFVTFIPIPLARISSSTRWKKNVKC